MDAQEPRPPQWALRFFRWICDPSRVEDLEGDLLERHANRLRERGDIRAGLWFIIDILTLLRPGLLRRFRPHHFFYNPGRLRHNLLIASRSLRQDKTTFSINLLGLSTGMACALLIYLWAADEWAVDRFHQERLFQVMHNMPSSDGTLATIGGTPGPLAEALRETIPGIEAVAVEFVAHGRQGVVSVEGVSVNAGESYVSPNYFELFSFPLHPQPSGLVLTEPHQVLLSETMAQALFGGVEEAVGKTVEWRQGNLTELDGSYEVTGVFRKPPGKSTAVFDLLFAFDLFRDKSRAKTWVNSWRNPEVNTYVIVAEDADIGRIERTMSTLLESKTGEVLEASAPAKRLFLQAYADRHLYNRFENGAVAGGRIEYLRIFLLVGTAILGIACINFMNLSTAQASRRMKEIGLKKTMGAHRGALTAQYLTESTAVALFASALALLWVAVALPGFNEITGKDLRIDWDMEWILAWLGVTLATGLAAGSYPAFYLSSLRPLAALKGKLSDTVTSTFARKGLVIFQFAVSVMLIFGVWVVNSQLQFIHTRNLGFEKDQILHFVTKGRLLEDADLFVAELRKMPGVAGASRYQHRIMVNRRGIIKDVSWQGNQASDSSGFKYMLVGPGFIETMGIPMAAGRAFSEELDSPEKTVVINRAGVESMGLQDPVGQILDVEGIPRRIVGVVENFHHESLYEPLRPLLMLPRPNCDNIAVRVDAEAGMEAVARIGQFYESFNPGFPFDPQFLDEEFQAIYSSENNVALLSWYFAGLAVVISCLGLFGLMAFTVERRTREIGIRKVLGAKVGHLVGLLSKEFLVLVGGALAVALPLSYALASRWLEGFAYRIDLTPWHWVGTAALTLLIAWLTVTAQTLKAAGINPVKALKRE